MSDDQARIAIQCSRNLKLEAKKAIAIRKEKWVNDGYLEIFKLGLVEYKKQKQEVKKNNG